MPPPRRQNLILVASRDKNKIQKVRLYFALVFVYNLICIVFQTIFLHLQSIVYYCKEMKLHLLMLYFSFAIYGYYFFWAICKGLNVEESESCTSDS